MKNTVKLFEKKIQNPILRIGVFLARIFGFQDIKGVITGSQN